MSRPWKPTKKCQKCGAMIDKKAKLCRPCYDKQRLNSVPQKEDLMCKIIELKWNFSALGRAYGVSDNAVRKWCRRYGIPTLKSDLFNYSPIA